MLTCVHMYMYESGIEVIIGELMFPTFYFANENKFWRQLCCIMKSLLKNENWLQTMIHQLFVGVNFLRVSTFHIGKCQNDEN